MIIADDLEIFPTCPAYGFSSDPFFLVKVVAREGGFERIDRKWAHPLRKFAGVPIGEKPEADVEAILHFWLVHGGEADSFRFRDYTDYRSGSRGDAAGATRQPLVEILDSPGGYQLTKRYQVGPKIYDRPIYRPRGDTISIYNEVDALQAPSTWELDEATGIVNELGGFTGVPTSWGGEFDIKCRFNGPFIPEVSNYRIMRADVSLIEKRELTP